MNLRETPEFLTKLNYLQTVLGEKGKTQTLFRAVDILHALAGGKDEHVGVDDFSPLVNHRLFGNKKASPNGLHVARLFSGFLYNLFRRTLWRPEITQEDPNRIVVESLLHTLELCIPSETLNDEQPWEDHEALHGYLVYSILEDGKHIGIIDGLIPSVSIALQSLAGQSEPHGPAYSAMLERMYMGYVFRGLKKDTCVFRTNDIVLGSITNSKISHHIPEEDKDVSTAAVKHYTQNNKTDSLAAVEEHRQTITDYLLKQDDVRYYRRNEDHVSLLRNMRHQLPLTT